MTESNCNCNLVLFFFATRVCLLGFCERDPPSREATSDGDDDEGDAFVIDTEAFAAGFAPNGFDGALLDIGGKAIFELLAGAFAVFAVFAPNGLEGALLDIGGNAAFALPLAGDFAEDFAPNGFDGALVDIGGNAAFVLLAGAFVADFAPNGLDGALLDIGGNAAFVLLAGAFAIGFAPNGFDGAVLDIGGKIEAGAFAAGFAPNGEAILAAGKLNNLVPEFGFSADLFPIPPNGVLEPLNAENGLFEFELSPVLAPNEANGLFEEGFAPNAVDVDGAAAAAAGFAPKGFVGAAFDIGGKAALLLLAGAFAAGFAPNGFVGAVLDIGGKAALEAGAFVAGFAPNGFLGATFDIGGKAGAFTAGFAPNGFVGAFFDMGGNAADELVVLSGLGADFVGGFSETSLSSTLVPKENPPAPTDDEEGAASGFGEDPPNEKPPAPLDDDEGAASGFAKEKPPEEAASGFAVAAPNEKPFEPIDEEEGAASGFVDPPKENPPAPIEEDDVAPPNENPPAPIDEDDGTFAGAPPRAASAASNPGRGVSHATHLFTLSLLRTEQTSHFHVDSSTLKILPSDSTFPSSLPPVAESR